MGDDKVQDAKGQAKEGIGKVTGNEDLENKGKSDQAKASLKGKIGDAVKSVKDKIGGLKKK